MASPPIDDDESIDALFESVGQKLGWFDGDALRRLTAGSTQKKKKMNFSKHREPTDCSLKGKCSKSVRKPQKNSSHTSSCEHDPLVIQQSVPSGTRMPLKELNAGSIVGATPDSGLVPSPTNRSSRSAIVCSPRKLSFSGCDSHSGDGSSDGVLLHEQSQPGFSSSAAASMSCSFTAVVECPSSLRSVVSAGTPVGDSAPIPCTQLSFSNCSRESSTPSSNGVSPKQVNMCATAATFSTGCLFDHSESSECGSPQTVSNSSSSGCAAPLPLAASAASSPVLQMPATSASNAGAVEQSCLCTSSCPSLVGQPVPDGDQGFDAAHEATFDKTPVHVADALEVTTAAEKITIPTSKNSENSEDAASNSVRGRSTIFTGRRCSEPCHKDVPFAEECEASDESVEKLFQNIGEKLGWFNDDKLLQLSQKASSAKKVRTKTVRSLRLTKVETEGESVDSTVKHRYSNLPSADDEPVEPPQPIRKVRGHKKVVPGSGEFASHSKAPLSTLGRIRDKVPPQYQQSRGTILSSDDDDEDDDKFEAFLAAVRSPSVPEKTSRTSGGARRSMDDFVVDNDEVEYDSSASPSSLPSPNLYFYSKVNRIIDTSEKKHEVAKRWQQHRQRSTSNSEHETSDDCSQDEPFDVLSDDSSLSDDDQENARVPARRPPPTPSVRLATAARTTPTRDSATLPKRTISFLKSLDADLPEGMARDPSTLKYLTNFRKNRDELVTRLHKLYNETVFNSKLTDVPVIWNKKLLKTAGLCYYITRPDQQRSARIELATKVVDRAERLRDTLLHEMCHAATWVVYQQRQGHGTLWQMWGRLACSVHSDLLVVSRCHSYAIAKKYTYRCIKCSEIYGRHSKSIDVKRHRCEFCEGVLELIVQDGRRTDAAQSNDSALRTPKTPGRFAQFVKENYGKMKAYGDVKKKHGEVMRALAEAFSQLPSGSGLTNGTARNGDY